MKIDDLNWYGWMNRSSGYGIVNLEYATALNRLTHGKVTVGWERKENMLPEHFSELSQEQKDLLKKPYVRSKIGIIKTTPQLFHKNSSEFRIGYTMVENTKIGQDWAEMCNVMDAIFVPSEFLVEVFKTGGVRVPIISVRQGINSQQFPYMERKRKQKFIFGTVGYQDERKNWADLVTAFVSEFSPDEPVELWIKNTNMYFAHTRFKDKRIKVINRTYSFEDMKRLYSLFDCFVFPSHAEGSGLPPREAMATGLPTILTNWSGMTEIANSEYCYPIDPISIDFPEASHRQIEQPGFQARLDVSELMYWMRYVYEHQSEGIIKGKKASEYIHKEYNWDACAKDLYQKLEKLI